MTDTANNDRRLTTLTGPDALPFLQGLVSNDVLALSDGPGIVWCALLTPQGKYLADFFVVNTGTQLLLDMKDSIADATLRRLGMYKLRAKVAFEPCELFLHRGTDTPPAGALADPRHPALGWRLYGPDRLADDSVNWDAIRVAHIIPETGIELLADDAYILEQGFDRLNGVNFRKGCYVGQEVTARMKHKTSLRKGLVRVQITGSAPPGTPVFLGDKLVGTLFTQSGDRALAHLRLDMATGPMQAGDAQITLD
jgi:tRNA-modifying protein YgfZ